MTARRRGLHLHAGEAGHGGRACQEGEDALEAAVRLKPDVILLDIRLAGEMDGYMVMEEFKRHPFLARVPVLIVTTTDSTRTSRAQGIGRQGISGEVRLVAREIAEKALAYAGGAKEEKTP